ASTGLWETLRRLRLDIARQNGIPPYAVFHDKTLKEMVALRPKYRQELLQITGVGEKKAEQYGDRFIAAIKASEPSGS
nr:HRDC domain-containing protein [Deltaproteobacteria bacterium]